MNDKTPMSREEEMLKSIAQQVNPSPSFTNELEKKLMNAHKPEKTGFFSVRKIAYTAGWTVALAALILSFIWVIRSIAPQPQPQPAAGDTPFPNVETAPESSALQKLIDYTVKEGDTCDFIAAKFDTTVEEIMKRNNITGVCRIMIDQILKIPVKAGSANLPQGESYETSMGTFIMSVDLPEAPAQAVLYQLDPARVDDKYKVVKVLELAGRLGVNGTLYYLSESYGGPGLMYTNGKQRIETRDYAPHQFTYFTDYAAYVRSNMGNVLSPEEMSAKAEEFLKAHNLLDFPYQIELPTDTNSRMVTFVPRLNDLSDSSDAFLIFETLQVSFDQKSEVATVDWNVQPWQPIDSYPLISAQQAWDKFVNNQLNGLGVDMEETGSPYIASPLKIWQRDIPLDQPTSIVGTVASFDPVNNGDTPLLTLDDISLIGNLEGLTNLQTVQLDGQYIMDGDVKKFQVDSWKPADFTPTLDGTLEQADGQNWLVTTDGKRLQIDDLPEDAAFGERTLVEGIVSGDKVDWRRIDQGLGGGGGGGGVPLFAKLNLSGTPMPTATLLPSPTPANYSSLIGSRLEGESGTVNVLNIHADNGSTYLAYSLYSNSEAGFLDSFWQVNLEGSATEGLEAYNRMPVKVWGTITSVNPQGVATIQLERYEPRYPDEKVRLWIGEEKAAQVEGQNVLLFTADDGVTYARDNSDNQEPIVPDKGYVFYIAGWSDPNEKIGEYSVINVMSIGTLAQDSNFDSVIKTILAPLDMKESDANLSGETPTGVVTRVELIYQGEDQLVAPSDGQVSGGQVLYAQPVWRFSGYYDKGPSSVFDITVQALPDEYLQPVPLQ